MRIYVGTLHTIENEFEDCVASIRRQTHTDFKHFVFSGLGNVEAHAALYGDFLAKRDQFDVMVKVDADMVLCDDQLFENIVSRMGEEGLSKLSIAVHDWFTDRLILGLNSYRNDIQWTGDAHGAFVDRVSGMGGGFSSDWEELAPAAYHCPNPTPFQAFHFGVHKATKVVQMESPSRVHWRMREHWDNIAETERHFQRSGDRRLGLVVLGSELVYAGVLRCEHVNYSNAYLAEVFSRYEHLDSREVLLEVRRLRARNMGWLPNRIRQAWFWYRFRGDHCYGKGLRALVMDCVFPRWRGSGREKAASARGR